MDMSKHNEPFKHEKELQFDNFREEMCTPISIIEKLQAMPKDWKKKLQFNRIYSKNANWRTRSMTCSKNSPKGN